MRKLILLMLLLAVIFPLVALKLGKIIIPDVFSVGEDELVLNGAGWRKKVIIKVYAGALYLMEQNKNAEAILAADEPIMIRMHFVYKNVSAEKLINAWNEGFANANVADSLQPDIDTFNSLFSKPALKGDIYDLIYDPTLGTSLFINDELIGTITGLEFKKAVFAIWLGENTALPGLKEKLLGN